MRSRNLKVQRLSERIHDLDWTSTPDMQSILAVGFAHHVDLLCQQRMTYFDEGPGWALCWKVDIGKCVKASIYKVSHLAHLSYAASFPAQSEIRSGWRMGHFLLLLDIKCAYMVNQHPPLKTHLLRTCSDTWPGKTAPWKTIIRKCYYNACSGVCHVT